ncbi:MAG: hypothetical protein QOH88_2961 [Verrucomicrobiota bacterium]|jgi:hypothetical protein
MNESAKQGPQFYFSMLRLLARLRGGDARRSENNVVEARLVGLLMYLVHYLFFATQLIPSNLAPWLTLLLLVAAAFWVWLFWLLLLYINSVILKLLRPVGLFHEVPTRRAQSILWGIVTTAMACALVQRAGWIRELGGIWLVAAAMNLTAAAILTFTNGSPAADK